MHDRFAADFGAVRLHAGPEARELSRAINARAFTWGNDIYLGDGAPEIDSMPGRRLIAHELTHTLQQRGGRAIQRQEVAAPQSAAEKLDSDYHDALAHGRWAEAAVDLNGFNNDDIKARVAVLTFDQRDAMRGACPAWNFRVRSALLDADYQDALARTDWARAAIFLNGFNDDDIDLRLAKLQPGQATNIAAGAMTALSWESQQRIINAVERLQKNPDQAAKRGALGTAVISDVVRMQQQGAGIATARAAAFGQLKLLVRTDPAPDVTADQRKDAVTKIAAAMAGAAAVIEPSMLSEGKIAHSLIGQYYAALNKPTLVDPSMITIIRALKLTKAAYDQLYSRLPEELLEALLVRPDILDLGKMQVYEIKSFDSAGRAVPEMLEYIELLESFVIPGIADFEFHPGSPSNPGTSGYLLAPNGGWVVWACPVPGAIIYRTLFRMENPRAAQEMLQNELRGASNMMVGVETATAISIMLAMSFEALIPLLIEAAGAAGQLIPEIAKAWPKAPLQPAFAQ